MNDPLNDIEHELLQLRPRPVSPRLKQSIAEAVAQPISIGRWYAPLALAASVAIAAAIIGFFAPSKESGPAGRVAKGSDASLRVDSAVPTVIAYQRAFAQSDADLAELLDRHAAASHASPISRTPPSPEAPLRWRDPRMFAPTSHPENPL